MVVLDASALLALIRQEPGHERVASALGDAAMSTVNVSEVLAKIARDGDDPAAWAGWMNRLDLRWVSFDREQALLTAMLVRPARSLGLSLGDRACLALARQLRCPALTADRAWLKLDAGVVIELIR